MNFAQAAGLMNAQEQKDSQKVLKAIKQGIISPILEPDYDSIDSSLRKQAKLEYLEKLRQQHSELDLKLPVEWRPHLSGKGSEAERLGLRHDYQVLNNYLKWRNLSTLPSSLLQGLAKNFYKKSKLKKKYRSNANDMPMYSASGSNLKFKSNSGTSWHERRCNAEVFIPQVGWIGLFIDPGLLNLMLEPGNSLRESCVLYEEHGRWFASLKTIRRETMHSGPRDGSVCGIDPGLDKLITVSDGKLLKNPRNLLYANAKELALSISDSIQDKEQRAEIREYVYRTDAKQRRKVHTQCRQLVAELSKLYEFIGIEVNSGVGSGQGSRYVGMTKTITRYLNERCGNNRIHGIEANYNSQSCSTCGYRDKDTWSRNLGKHDQTCTCIKCGLVLDRDLNAAINVRNKLADTLGLSYCQSQTTRAGANPQAPGWRYVKP
jgi:putative transposase